MKQSGVPGPAGTTASRSARCALRTCGTGCGGGSTAPGATCSPTSSLSATTRWRTTTGARGCTAPPSPCSTPARYCCRYESAAAPSVDLLGVCGRGLGLVVLGKQNSLLTLEGLCVYCCSKRSHRRRSPSQHCIRMVQRQPQQTPGGRSSILAPQVCLLIICGSSCTTLDYRQRRALLRPPPIKLCGCMACLLHR